MTQRVSKMHQRINATQQERVIADHEASRQKAISILEGSNAIPKNTYWDDANAAYHEIENAIEYANGQLAQQVALAMQPEHRPQIKDETLVAQNLNLVTRDILSCREQLGFILKRHAGKTGGAVTPADLIEVMEINDLYGSALSMYNGNIMPVVTYIFELLNLGASESQEALDQQAVMADKLEGIVIKLDDSADPNIITDVVIKEIKQG